MNRILAVVLLTACTGSSVSSNVVTDTGEAMDLDPPTITHTPISTAQAYGLDIPIDATVSDPSGVAYVEIVYRQETASAWKSKGLNLVGGDLYQGTIPGDDVGSAGMRYYLHAADYEENEGCAPDDCELDPYGFSVTSF